MTRTLSETPWQELARCGERDADPSLFDEWDRVWESLPEATARAARAWRTYCQACPVAQQCLDDALDGGDVGVRGGYLLRRNHSAGGHGIRRFHLAPCGTYAAYRRHLFHGEECATCRRAAQQAWRKIG